MDVGMGMPDIALLSMAKSQTETLQKVGTAVLSKALDEQEVQGDKMVQMMEQSVNPGLGSNFDMRI